MYTSNPDLEDSSKLVFNVTVKSDFVKFFGFAPHPHNDVASVIVIRINAKYFFGEPVANATVKGTLNGEEFSGLTNQDGIYNLINECLNTEN